MMRHKPASTFLFAAALMSVLSLAARAQNGAPVKTAAPLATTKPSARWVWMMNNLLSDDQLAQAQAVMKRAKAAGYNGVVLADYKLGVLDQVSPHYFDNARAFIKTAHDLGMDIVPAVAPIGYSASLLAHDPNLAEGVPVRDAPFVVKGKTAELQIDSSTRLQNGDFETAKNNTFAGWNYQDAPGSGTFADTQIKHSGAQSLRIDNIGAASNPANGRVIQTLKVHPWRQYHLSVWLKTQDFETPGSVWSLALTPTGRSLIYAGWKVARTQEWTQYHAVFNSLDNSSVNIYCGVWGGRGGKMWMDDLQVEEVGLLNVLRRAGCPLTVKSETGTLYQEGRDFETVKDPRLGNIPWAGEYEIYHEAPPIRLAANSLIKDGQKLLVSFYHPIVTNGEQVACCLSEPAVYTLLQDQIRRVNALFHPKAFLLSHDELRVANWCEACQSRKMTPGQLLADNVKRCIAFVRAANPQAKVYVWSDMFDPNHNAVDNYYLVNGTLAGSWNGLDKNVGVFNWNFDHRQQSLPFFAARGQDQVLAGYYDDRPQQIRDWLDATKGVPNVSGVMYTTWSQRYDDLEAFAQQAWGK